MANKKELTLLGVIIAAMANADAPFHMATEKELGNLVKDGLAETNPEISEGDKIAVRATDAGVAAFNAANAPVGSANEGTTETVNTPATGATAAAAATAFVVGTGFVPSAVRGGKGRNLYDFESLETGGFIFVPKTADKPNPAKSLASTVSSATARFAVPKLDGNNQPVTKTVKVKDYQKDGEGKIAKDAEGKRIVVGEHEETKPEMVETRKFGVQSVEKGKVYGSFTAPDDGAVIYRSA